MKMKKICAGAAAVLMAVTCLSLTAFAADEDNRTKVEENRDNGVSDGLEALVFPGISAAAGVAAGLIINKKRRLSH